MKVSEATDIAEKILYILQHITRVKKLSFVSISGKTSPKNVRFTDKRQDLPSELFLGVGHPPPSPFAMASSQVVCFQLVGAKEFVRSLEWLLFKNFTTHFHLLALF